MHCRPMIMLIDHVRYKIKLDYSRETSCEKHRHRSPWRVAWTSPIRLASPYPRSQLIERRWSSSPDTVPAGSLTFCFGHVVPNHFSMLSIGDAAGVASAPNFKGRLRLFPLKPNSVVTPTHFFYRNGFTICAMYCPQRPRLVSAHRPLHRQSMGRVVYW